VYWTNDALCKHVHNDLWFPPSFKEDRTAPESQYYEIAKMVCEQCSVVDSCRDLGSEEDHGVWGGTAPKDRVSGEVKRPKKLLPIESISVLPLHEPDIRVDIPSLRNTLKAHTKRRPRVTQ